MKIQIKRDGEYIKGFVIEYSVSEMLIVNKALRQFSKNGENAFVDCVEAYKMAENLSKALKEEE